LECLEACPYGAPQKDVESDSMAKCNFCYDLIDEKKNPVCIDACPMRAISYGSLEELKAEFGEVNAVEPLPASDLTEPSLILTPHRHSLIAGTGSGRILNLEGEL
jgi:anaerobic dimethyl sulfoxide reductase subunit B (iron-sulfur subunit)